MFIHQMNPQQLAQQVARAQAYINYQLPKLQSNLPSLANLVTYNQGRFIVECLKSAQDFFRIRPTVNTYKQLLPQLEKHLRTIITFADLKQGNIIITTKGDDSSSSSQGASAPSTTVPCSSAASPHAPSTTVPCSFPASPSTPKSFSDYPAGSLPSHITAFFPHVARLRTELSIAKENLNVLADNHQASQEELARLANIVAIKDERWRNFRQRVSLYYDKYQEYKIDQKELDRLEKRAEQLESLDKDSLAIVEKPSVPLSSMPIQQILSFPESEERTMALKARIERNKKYLRRTDRQKSEDLTQSIKEAVAELHAADILITDKQAEVCALFGYEVPKDWQEPSIEERKAAQAQAKLEKAKAKRAEAAKEREALKAELQASNPYVAIL